MKSPRKVLVRRKVPRQLHEQWLRGFVRKILSEELVTIIRDSGDEEVWDVDITGGSITKSEKQEIEDNLEETVDIAKMYTTHPRGSIAKELIRIQNISDSGGVRQSWPGSESEAADILKKYWMQTALWNPTNRIGRGEATFHMAFETTDFGKEPDAIIDDTTKFSVKAFGTDGARTGTTASTELREALVELAGALRLPSQATTGSVFEVFTENITTISFSNKSLEAHLSQFPADVQKKIGQDAMTPLEAVKKAIITEHDAKGIFAFLLNENSVEFIPPEDHAKIGISRIFGDGRIGFVLSSTKNYETVLGR